MLSEGAAAPLFELPGLVDGEHQQVALSDYLGEDVVILAFYPADFNPACDETSCDLGELDLFTMQKDVTILGISPDSVYSHRAFADRYDLKVPLLSDTDHDVAREYGIDFVDDIGQQLIERAVVVIDHDGEVQYAWSTDDLRQLPHVEEIKDAIADTGGDDTAFARYRIGHAHYMEGRRVFTAAMNDFRDSEWMVAQGAFQQAREEFAAAEDHFDTAVRFVEDESLKPIYEGAKTKASSLWQAADWLTQGARAYSRGSGKKGQELRDDAERPLEIARGYEEPPDPDGPWPPGAETLEKDESGNTPASLPKEEEDADTTLGVDIDDEAERADAESAVDRDEGPEHEPTTAAGSGLDSKTATAPAGEGEVTAVDESDIEEIQAELAASEAEAESTDPLESEPTAMVDAPPDTVSDDPTDGEPNGETPGSDVNGAATNGPTTDRDSAGDADGESVELELTDPMADESPDGETDGNVAVAESSSEPGSESDRDVPDEREPDT
ncbi:MAG: redoxin domain-containing protein [Haloarcula sp.]